MRPLGLGATTIKDATVNGISYMTHQSTTMSRLLEFWNKWEIQLMVLTSFVLQLFLLLTGHLRRRKICGPLRVSIWLAYVGADLVAVYALGLFSQYEKYLLRRESFGDTSVFLWVPFLLVHLGGQDSVTAFSIEDNNLWLRHLLNLGIQGTLALYVFWKSVHRLNTQVLFPAPFVFVSGILKYGERTWALRIGSRDGLGKSSLKRKEQQQALASQEEIHGNDGGVCCISSRARRASHALQTVHLAQGLFVGRTMLQLGDGAKEKFEKYFKTDGVAVEEKLRITVLELGMMFDLLYTKAMVLQSKAGCVFRFAAQVCMVVAFVLFVVQDRKHSSSRVDTAISYTLFVGAILMEACSIATVIASPWTRAHLDDSPFLGWLYSCSNKAAFSPVVMKAVVRQCRNMRWPCQQRPSTSYSIGQYNHVDCFVGAPLPRIICKVISAVGVGNLWLVKRVEAQGIVDYVVRWFDRSPEEYFSRRLQLGRRLNYTLCLPFEHALYRLQLYMDLHISKHFDIAGPGGSTTSHAADVMLLREDCEKLSNYMAYLAEAYPSMLPVSTVVKGGGLPSRSNPAPDRRSILVEQEKALFNGSEPDSASPFEPVLQGNGWDLKRSLEEIREMWMRLLVYAAGKCSGELHARQLSNGCELLTIVWLLMLHNGLGDAATEVNLLTSDDPSLPEPGSIVAAEGSNWGLRPEQPRHAFDFRCHHSQMDLDSNAPQSEEERRQQLQLQNMMQQIVPQVMAAAKQSLADGTTLTIHCITGVETEEDGATTLGGALEHHETGTSSEAGPEGAATASSCEIEEQDAVPMVQNI